MKGSKQSKADHQQKQIQALINVVQQLLDETAYLKDLSVGTLETIKLMPGYQAAIMQLKEEVEKNKDQDESK
jgi:beta-phosphoglucomutase-like phosphatase (HAD superfamily)